MVKIETNYASAVEVVQVNETIIVDEICSKLSPTLTVETYSCSKTVETEKTIDRFQFKENCGWNEKIGYYCEERVLR